MSTSRRISDAVVRSPIVRWIRRIPVPTNDTRKVSRAELNANAGAFLLWAALLEGFLILVAALSAPFWLKIPPALLFFLMLVQFAVFACVAGAIRRFSTHGSRRSNRIPEP